MIFQLPKIYPITDTAISGISHGRQAEKLIAGGARLIQIRDKAASSRDLYAASVEAMKVAANTGCLIIINDRVDIALACGAAGVHLGQDDMPVTEARKLLGTGAVIGLSTHSVEQALEAVELPLDYIAIGPAFTTATKEQPYAAFGPEGIRKVRKAIGTFPLVAIGGINSENLESIFEAGADSAAIISYFAADADLIQANMEFLIKQTSDDC